MLFAMQVTRYVANITVCVPCQIEKISNPANGTDIVMDDRKHSFYVKSVYSLVNLISLEHPPYWEKQYLS